MSLTNITKDSSTTVDVDRNYNVYLLDVTDSITGSAFIYNLPEIVCNGENYNFTRLDNSDNTFTLTAAAGDLMCETTDVTSTTLEITQFRNIEIVSLDNCWYSLFNSPIKFDNQVKICAAYQGNNQDHFINYTGNSAILFLPFVGTDAGDMINSVTILMSDVSITEVELDNGIFSDTGTIPVVNGKKIFNHILTNAEKDNLKIDRITNMRVVVNLIGNVDIYSTIIY